MKWVFDIASIVKYKATALRWDSLMEHCVAAGCRRTLLASLRLASLLFHVNAPERVAEQILKDASAIRVAERIKTALLENETLGPRDLLECHIQMHDRLWDRLFVAVTVNVPDLPRLLPVAARPLVTGPLRFVTRPVRLLRLYGLDWLRTTILSR